MLPAPCGHHGVFALRAVNDVAIAVPKCVVKQANLSVGEGLRHGVLPCVRGVGCRGDHLTLPASRRSTFAGRGVAFNL